MSRDGLRLLAWPLVLFAFVTGNVVALSLAHPFSPDAPAAEAGAEVVLGDFYNGETLFQQTCAGCHGDGGRSGGVGPPLAGRGLDPALVSAIVDRGAGAMPPRLVTGTDKADVLAYVASITTP
jgi:mono/diheme cytochrome c family protein